MQSLDNVPNTKQIVSTLIAVWPEHERYLASSFASRSPALMASTERHAGYILKMAGSDEATLRRYCADYQFLCGVVLEEELFFRRNDRYRLTTFAEAYREVYSNQVFMDRYMNFLLLSHVVWTNHAQAMAHFEDEYLAMLPEGANHLEIGPGHGLLLLMAAQNPKIVSVTGWDVSETSIAQTRHCLKTMGVTRDVKLVLQDLFEAPRSDKLEDGFDSVVLAEVLEHLEDPVAALKGVSQHMRKNGLLWIHVPINSPAPDHLYLLRTPEEAVELVRAGGFEPIDQAFYPMTGTTIERARKQQLTISAVITGRKMQ